MPCCLNQSLKTNSTVQHCQATKLPECWPMTMRKKSVRVHLPMQSQCNPSAKVWDCDLFDLQDLNSEVRNLIETDVPAPQRSCLEKNIWLSGNSTVSGNSRCRFPDTQSSIFVWEISNLPLSIMVEFFKIAHIYWFLKRLKIFTVYFSLQEE